MSHTCLIRFAPQTCIERYNDPRWQRPRVMYDPGSLKMLPGKTSIPLIVNHDDDRVVGSVRSFSRMEEVDGPWTVAHATIDRCPEWLRKDATKASFGFKVLFANPDVFGCEVVRDAFVTEVSILSPDRRPKEPGARVIGLWEQEAPRPAAAPVSAPAGQVFYGRGAHAGEAMRQEQSRRQKRLRWEEEELRRRVDAAGPNANFELIHKALMLELGYGSIHDLMAAA